MRRKPILLSVALAAVVASLVGARAMLRRRPRPRVAVA